MYIVESLEAAVLYLPRGIRRRQCPVQKFDPLKEGYKNSCTAPACQSTWISSPAKAALVSPVQLPSHMYDRFTIWNWHIHEFQMSQVENELKRRLVEASSQQASNASVSIRSVNHLTGSVPPLVDRLALPPGCIPTAVHGGPMLGINVKIVPSPEEQGTGTTGTNERAPGSLQLPEANQSGHSARERLLLFDWQGNLQGGTASAHPLWKCSVCVASATSGVACLCSKQTCRCVA
jgi:hypothetical protein